MAKNKVAITVKYVKSEKQPDARIHSRNNIKQNLHPNLSCCLYIVIVHNFIQWQVTWTRQVFSDKKKNANQFIVIGIILIINLVVLQYFSSIHLTDLQYYLNISSKMSTALCRNLSYGDSFLFCFAAFMSFCHKNKYKRVRDIVKRKKEKLYVNHVHFSVL